MRLLFLTSRLPFPPDRGDRSRVFNFLKRLSAQHEITLVSFISNEREREHLESLSEFCSDVHVVLQTPLQSRLATARNFWRDTPLQVLYYRSNAMQQKLDEVVATSPFDAVYTHLFRMAPYAVHLHNLYRIVDLTDVISLEIKKSLPFRGLLSRILYSLEGARIERYECRIAGAFDETWLIAERDRQILAHTCPEASLHVVPNGVDLDRFYPAGSAGESVIVPAAGPDPNALLFVGNMSVLHNIDAVLYFVHEVFPLVRRELPEAHLSVVGADPVSRITALDGSHPGVTVTGFVDDLNSVMRRASVFVAPLRFAAGVQTKVIEAMAAGMAVVTTSNVNEGIEAVPGRDILIADDAVTLATHVVNLCRDSAQQRRLGIAARRFAGEHFNWAVVADRMLAIEILRRDRTRN